MKTSMLNKCTDGDIPTYSAISHQNI